MSRNMKDSGVEWIGEIPSTWKYLKSIYIYDKIGDIDHYMPDSVDNGVPYVMTGNLAQVASKINFEACKQISVDDYKHLSKKITPNKGDILLARYATIGTVCYVDIEKEFLVSYSCVTIKPKKSIVDGKYLWYYYQSSAFLEEIKKLINANTQANVGVDSLYRANLVIPSLNVQKQIVTFLDKKCNQIHSLISNQQRQIEKLKQYKQSLITEVVTKGLNPDVEMKDSGVEWIEKIPSSWSVHTLKGAFSFSKGLPITKADLVEKGTAVISYGQIHAKYNCSTHVDKRLLRYVPDTFAETHPQCFVKKDDFIFADTSEDVAGSGDFVYIDTDEPIFAGYHTIVLKPKKEQRNRYLAYLFMSDMWKKQIQCRVSGVKLFSISRGILGKVSYILPPEKEQEEISNFLENKCWQIDRLISIKQQKIEKLNQYKKSIIYEYVTGKKEA